MTNIIDKNISDNKKLNNSTNTRQSKTNLNIDERINKMIEYEKTRYKSKGYGLMFAFLICFFYFIYFPKILKHIFYNNTKESSLIFTNPGKFYFFSMITVHFLAWLASNLIFMFIYKLNIPFFERYKTSSDNWPWEENYDEWIILLKRTFKYLIINQSFLLVLLYIHNYMFDYCPFRTNESTIPSLYEILYQMLFFMVVEDFAFYSTHRLLHHKKLYTMIHKVHHSYKQVVSISAEFCHPIEFILSNLIPTILGPVILGYRVHILTYFMWVIFRIFETSEGHSGYEFSFSPFRLCFFSSGQEFHNFHHLYFVNNYSSFFVYWDYIFGTVSPKYLKYVEIKKNKLVKND